MLSDTDAILDDLLCRWAQWCRPVRVGRGFNHKALVAGQYQTSRQYHDGEMNDEDADHARMKTVDYEVSEMRDPWRTAIHVQARALVVGVAVFSSPRLPQDAADREALVIVARGMLVERLQRAGVL